MNELVVETFSRMFIRFVALHQQHVSSPSLRPPKTRTFAVSFSSTLLYLRCIVAVVFVSLRYYFFYRMVTFCCTRPVSSFISLAFACLLRPFFEHVLTLTPFYILLWECHSDEKYMHTFQSSG
uniref:Uncharacterized protein n=1 Tax=Trypanosoma congolense (strain IL3000) TaxID=1068625 RepID=G0UN55_TRYCI|nr:hypothetical protein, unlikely [Trypanosoma congolense IL3000]